MLSFFFLKSLWFHTITFAGTVEEEWMADAEFVVHSGHGHIFWTEWPLLEHSQRISKTRIRETDQVLGQGTRISGSL
jgi:hypothetical protein